VTNRPMSMSQSQSQSMSPSPSSAGATAPSDPPAAHAEPSVAHADRSVVAADDESRSPSTGGPMLLSRVAEAVYWTGRYLERAEATARLLKVHTELFLDLPKSAGVDWEPLLLVTGGTEAFRDLYREPGEEDVVAFLGIDARNPDSILGSLDRARTNMRTARFLFPRELCEGLNNQYLLAVEECEEAVPRRSRMRWLDSIVAECQRMSGIISGAMNHDEVYAFLRIGRLVERADMTTRVLDVCAATFFHSEDQLRPYADVTWMSVLKSLSAYHTYRRHVQTRVRGADAMAFLLRDPQFPRSVEHCLIEISRSLIELPRHDEPLRVCAEAETMVSDVKIQSLAWEGLHRYADQLQQQLGVLHLCLEEQYFAVEAHAPSELATA